jgi:uncharacterized protein YjbJ (UPF0337 family)
MDWNRIAGNWQQFKGQVREKWGRLTDDDLDLINGGRTSWRARFKNLQSGRGRSQKGCRGLVQDTAVDSGTLG